MILEKVYVNIDPDAEMLVAFQTVDDKFLYFRNIEYIENDWDVIYILENCEVETNESIINLLVQLHNEAVAIICEEKGLNIDDYILNKKDMEWRRV